MSTEAQEEKARAPTVNEEATEEAASALTALSISSNGEEEYADESFEIPHRFTKSGRQRAVPFPLKVRMVQINARALLSGR